MLILRILSTLLVISVGACAVVYLVTKNRMWLRFGVQVLKLGLLIMLIFIILFALERFATAI